MKDLLHLLFALDEGGCLRINSDGEHIFAYFKDEAIPDDLRNGIIQYRGELLQRLKRPCQEKGDIKAKGVLII